MAWIKKGDKYGFVNKYGVETTPCRYSSYIRGEAGYKHFYNPDFSEGLALVKKGSKWVYINKHGDAIFALKKKSMPAPILSWHFSDGVAWITKDLTSQIIDKSGNVLASAPDYFKNGQDNIYIRSIGRFVNGLALSWNDKFNRCVLVNKKMEIVAVLDSKFNIEQNYQNPNTQLIVANWLYENYYDSYSLFTYDDLYLQASFKLFLKLAKEGNSYAQYVVGFMYQYGQGTDANELESINWYYKSKEPDAKKMLAVLEGKDNIQEFVKKEEPVLLVDAKVKNNKSEIVTQPTHVESKTNASETSQDNMVAQNITQVQEQSPEQRKQPTTGEKKTEKRIALLIGNAKYKTEQGFNPLKSPEYDVDDLKCALEKLGFNHVVRTNLNQLQMKEVIQNFCDTIKNYDVALFYYSGHAFQNKGVLRLAPVNEDLSKYGDRDNAVRFDFVLNTLIDSEVKTKILILDACRSRKHFKGGDEDRWTTPANHGCFVAFATSAGDGAADGGFDGRNSVYTKALLESLNLEGNLDDIFNDVENKVYIRTRNSDMEQRPDHKNELFPRNFYLHKLINL